jgi:hypothetical protein
MLTPSIGRQKNHLPFKSWESAAACPRADIKSKVLDRAEAMAMQWKRARASCPNSEVISEVRSSVCTDS